jgi:hypothetical protein
LYKCKTWTLILRDEHRLKVFENRKLRRIFGPKREKVSPNIIRVITSRRIKWVGHVARTGMGEVFTGF